MGMECTDRTFREFVNTRVAVSSSLKTLSIGEEQFAAYVSLESTKAQAWHKNHFTWSESRTEGYFMVRMETLNRADHVICLAFSDQTGHGQVEGGFWIPGSAGRSVILEMH